MSKLLADRLRQAGYKLTDARRAILQVVETMGAHLDYAEALERGRALYPSLGRATVYRTLNLLAGVGVLRPIRLSNGSVCFIRAEGGHHHLVCLNCGVAVHFDDCPVEELGWALARRLGFQVQSHMLEFYGLCKDCQP